MGVRDLFLKAVFTSFIVSNFEFFSFVCIVFRINTCFAISTY